MRLCAVVVCLFLAIPGALTAQDDRYALSCSDAAGAVGDQIGVTIDLDLIPGVAGAPVGLIGWSFEVCHDSAALALLDVEDGSSTAALANGSGPSFNSVNLYTGGFTVAVLASTFGGVHLPVGLDRQLNVATYQALSVGTTGLHFCEVLGTPPVETLVVQLGSQAVIPDQKDGSVVSTTGGPAEFMRGDANGDGLLNLTDGIFLLKWLFAQGTVGSCSEAADADASGQLTLADPSFLFQYLFVSGPAPAAPFPQCGSIVLFVGCASYTGCP